MNSLFQKRLQLFEEAVDNIHPDSLSYAEEIEEITAAYDAVASLIVELWEFEKQKLNGLIDNLEGKGELPSGTHETVELILVGLREGDYGNLSAKQVMASLSKEIDTVYEELAGLLQNLKSRQQ